MPPNPQTSNTAHGEFCIDNSFVVVRLGIMENDHETEDIMEESVQTAALSQRFKMQQNGILLNKTIMQKDRFFAPSLTLGRLH